MGAPGLPPPQKFIACLDILGPEPPNFAKRAWGAYTECVKATSYYFSVAELTVIAAGAKRNVGIFSSIGTELRYETGYFGGVGPTVILKLTGNNQRRVSSHFERLIAAEHAEGLLKERENALQQWSVVVQWSCYEFELKQT